MVSSLKIAQARNCQDLGISRLWAIVSIAIDICMAVADLLQPYGFFADLVKS